MIDITRKSSTHRNAVALAIVEVGAKSCIDALLNKKVPKGDVFEMSKAAGLLAIKKTSALIPDCHPIPIEYSNIEFQVHDLQIHIIVNASTIYKTGIEVEVMHGASVVALTIYDMLKPIDKNIEIKSIKLLSKTGGKADYRDNFKREIKAAVVVCSDSVSLGKKEDKAGLLIKEKLSALQVEVSYYKVIPDEKSLIQDEVMKACRDGIDLLLFTGGTGLSERDVTPDAVQPMLDREIPGIMEAARNYGQQRTPYSMLSRGIAGIRESTLILTLPGSTRGAAESMDMLFPSVMHIFRVLEGVRHE